MLWHQHLILFLIFIHSLNGQVGRYSGPKPVFLDGFRRSQQGEYKCTLILVYKNGEL